MRPRARAIGARGDRGGLARSRAQVDQIGEVTVTNDGATILQQLEVEHPAARVRAARRGPPHPWLRTHGIPRTRAAQVLVELAHLQDQEVGDGTTSVVILAAELLRVREAP